MGMWSIHIYNNLVKLNENVKTQWSQVENVCQRRYDLIPNLVNTVKGSADFEKDTLNQIVRERSKAYSFQVDPNNLNQNQINKFQNLQENLNRYMGKLLLIVEKYPNLKSTENFHDLQNQIEGTENRINIERNRFNQQVNNFNIYRNQFPINMIGHFFLEFKNKGYFTSKIESKEPYSVYFYH